MSNEHKLHVEFPGRILFIGFGSIGQGVLPLILRHIGIAPERITIVTAEDKGNEEAAKYGIRFIKERLTRENFRRVLNPLLGRGDFLGPPLQHDPRALQRITLAAFVQHQ